MFRGRHAPRSFGSCSSPYRWENSGKLVTLVKEQALALAEETEPGL